MIELEKEKKDKIRKSLRELVNAKNDLDSDMDGMIKRAVEIPERIYDIEDSFHFDKNICMDECGGLCCLMTDMVRVTPIDVDYMMKSPFAKKMELSRSEFVNTYLDTFLGHDSLIPIAVIKMKEMHLVNKITGKREVFYICPFLDINPNRREICGLGHVFKPSSCGFYPLGRIINHDKNEEIEAFILVRDCLATKTTREVAVRDHISNRAYRNELFKMYIMTLREFIQEKKETMSEQEITETMTEVGRRFFFEQTPSTGVKLKKLRKGLKETG